ncbi:hypothetical protein V6Z11_A02G019600 [Gossypium hirsutum]
MPAQPSINHLFTLHVASLLIACGTSRHYCSEPYTAKQLSQKKQVLLTQLAELKRFKVELT